MVDNENKAAQSREDEVFAARFRAAWGRPEMTPAQAAGFMTRLDARRQRGERPFRLMPAALGVAVVAALVTVVFVGRHQGTPGDDGFLASLAEAEAVAATVVVEADGTSQDVAYADTPDGLWAVMDDEGQEVLKSNLSNEYAALDSWVFPAQATAQESSNQK